MALEAAIAALVAVRIVHGEGWRAQDASWVVRTSIGVMTTFLVVRQAALVTMTFTAAAIQVRSFGATTAVLAAALLGAGGAWLAWALLRRLPAARLDTTTRVFAALYLAQAAFYTVHKAAECRWLPWSEWVDAATEPYGPDSPFGWYVSALLLLLPLAAVLFYETRRVRLLVPVLDTLAGRYRALACAAVLVPLAATGTLEFRLRHPVPAEPVREAGTSSNTPHAVNGPRMLFVSRDTSPATFSHLAMAPLRTPDVVTVTDLRCERVAFAEGRGICLQAARGVFTSYRAVFLDAAMQPRASVALDGAPSRTRVSPDGRVGAITVFVGGLAHSYVSLAVSTKTTLVDVDSGEILADLEQFRVIRDGRPFSAVDFNFWGVTFARDHNTFYATLRSAGRTYLVRGDLGLRRMTVLHENVECPSISPDNRLIAYKKRVGPAAAPWRLWILDLATLQEHPIEGELRSVDDQIEWLDATHILYGVPRSLQSAAVDVWIAAVDDHEPARVFLKNAESPIIVR